MDIINFMVEKEKNKIVEEMKAKLICQETGKMLNSINDILNEKAYLTNKSPVSFVKASIDQIKDIIKKVFNENITIEIIAESEERSKVTTTFEVSYKEIEIADLKVISETIK